MVQRSRRNLPSKAAEGGNNLALVFVEPFGVAMARGQTRDLIGQGHQLRALVRCKSGPSDSSDPSDPTFA